MERGVIFQCPKGVNFECPLTPGHGPLLRPLGQRPPGEDAEGELDGFPLRFVEEEFRRVPSKGWAAIIGEVYDVDTMVCPKCGGTMKVIAFLTEHTVVDKIIDHLKLAFASD
jgi:hypothetical protein